MYDCAIPKRVGSGYPTLPPGLKTNRPGSVTLRTEVVTGVCRSGINCGSYRFGRKDAYKHTKNCDDSWVVTTEGPRGPKCTKSAGALRKSTGTLDTSTGALQGEWGALEEGWCLYSAV